MLVVNNANRNCRFHPRPCLDHPLIFRNFDRVEEAVYRSRTIYTASLIGIQ